MYHLQASVPCPGERERKQWLLGAHLLRLGRGTVATNAGVCKLPAVVGTCRQLQQTGTLALVGVPPTAHKGGTGVWGWWWPCPPRASQQWHLAFQGDHTSSRGTPGYASPQSCPLCCIQAANSAPLPGYVLPSPRFSTQPQPASADCHPRQGHPGLIPK